MFEVTGGGDRPFGIFIKVDPPVPHPLVLPITTLSINFFYQKNLPEEKHLPSLDCKRYYFQGIWASSLRIIYHVSDKMLGFEFLKNNRLKVKELTIEAFEKRKEKTLLALNIYEQHLHSLQTDVDHVDKEQYQKTIRTLTVWNQWMTSYLEKKNYDGVTWEKFTRIKNLQPLIKLESLLKTPLPFALLLKISNSTHFQIAHGDDLEKHEERQLFTWIQELNEMSERSCSFSKTTHLLTISALQKGLEVLLNSPFVKVTSKNPVDLILLKLHIRGCRLFIKDEEQLKFREEVFKKREINVNGEKIALGEPLAPLNFETEDRFHVYPLKTIPSLCKNKHDYVAFFPDKRTINSYTHFLYMKDEQTSIKNVEIEISDYHGKFGICRKMPMALKDYCWSSTTSLSITDKKIVEQVAVLIKTIIQKQLTPKNLDIKVLLLDDTHELFSSRVFSFYPQSDFHDYIKLEKLAFTCAKDSPLAFRSLMEKSTLSEQKEYSFFKKLVQQALEKPLNLTSLFNENINQINEKSKQHLQDKGLEIAATIAKHKKEILEKVSTTSISNVDALKKIKKLYLQKYLELGYGCMLPDELVNKVINAYK